MSSNEFLAEPSSIRSRFPSTQDLLPSFLLRSFSASLQRRNRTRSRAEASASSSGGKRFREIVALSHVAADRIARALGTTLGEMFVELERGSV